MLEKLPVADPADYPFLLPFHFKDRSPCRFIITLRQGGGWGLPELFADLTHIGFQVGTPFSRSFMLPSMRRVDDLMRTDFVKMRVW